MVSVRAAQPVIVQLPSAAYDSHNRLLGHRAIRRGGDLLAAGRLDASDQRDVLDNYDDAAAEAGEALDFDNFEPWRRWMCR